MKILHIVASVPGYPGSGGAEKFCFDLAAHQKQKGMEAEVAAPYDSKEYQGVKIHRLHKVSNKWLRKLFFDYWNPFNGFRLRKILREVKPDVVHFHNFYGIGAQLASYTSKRIPTVITAHDYWPFCYWASLMYDFAPCDYCIGGHPQFKLRNFFHWLHTKINKRFFRRCKLISPSEYLADKLRSLGEFKNAEAVSNGVDIKSSITNYEKIILWVGRISWEKGLSTIANPLNEISKKYPDWKVIVVGDGPEKISLQTQFKNIEFAGYANPYLFYQRASIYVMSSVWPENLPMTVLESMGMGLCVIAPRLGGIPEMVMDGKSGYLTDEKNPLINILEKLIHHPEEIKELGGRAKKIIEEKFSFEKCIGSHNRIYDEVILNANNKG